MARRRRPKPTVLEAMGTVSHGTMRNEDLIPEFVWQLNQLRLTKDERQFVKGVEEIINDENAQKYYDDEWADEDASDDCVRLMDILDAHTPPFCYFGSHPGDGCDYGVWVSDEALNDAEADHELWRTDGPLDLLREGIWLQHQYVLQVNDHGNMTLWRIHVVRTKKRDGRPGRPYPQYFKVWEVV